MDVNLSMSRISPVFSPSDDDDFYLNSNHLSNDTDRRSPQPALSEELEAPENTDNASRAFPQKQPRQGWGVPLSRLKRFNSSRAVSNHDIFDLGCTLCEQRTRELKSSFKAAIFLLSAEISLKGKSVT